MTRKRRAFLALQAALAGLTYVESKTYPPHNRSPRGTYKEARCNEAFQENSEKTPSVSGLASPLLWQFKELAGAFAHKQLWQQMTGRMFKVSSTHVTDLLKSLDGLELNQAYPFSRISSPPHLQVKHSKKQLIITFTPQGSVHFPARMQINSYYYTITALWIGNNKKHMEAETIETEWIVSREIPGTYEMAFERPSWAGYYLLVVSAQAGRDGKPVESFAARGTQVVGSRRM
jgi:hypothetical protein